MKDLHLKAEPCLALTGTTPSPDVSKANRFRWSGSSAPTFTPSGAGADGQTIWIEIANSGGGAITPVLATGSTNNFEYDAGISALPALAAGAVYYVAAIYRTSAQRWHVTTLTGDFAFSNASNAAGSDVTMTNAGQFYDGASITLTAGTWLIIAHITMGRANTTLIRYTARIRNSTDNTNHASGQATEPSQNPHYVTITLSCILTITSSKTFAIQGATITTGGCLIKAAAADNASGNNATMINALKIG